MASQTLRVPEEPRPRPGPQPCRPAPLLPARLAQRGPRRVGLSRLLAAATSLCRPDSLRTSGVSVHGQEQRPSLLGRRGAVQEPLRRPGSPSVGSPGTWWPGGGSAARLPGSRDTARVCSVNEVERGSSTGAKLTPARLGREGAIVGLGWAGGRGRRLPQGGGGVALPACGGCAGSRHLEIGRVSFAAVGTFIFVSHFGTGQSQLGGCPRRREPLAKVGGGPSPGRGPPPYRGRELRAVNAASSQRGPHLVLSRPMPRGCSLWGSRALC